MVKSYRPKYSAPATPKKPSTKISKPLHKVQSAKQIAALAHKPMKARSPKVAPVVYLKPHPKTEIKTGTQDERMKRQQRTVL
jgi:hypothetical protein